MRLRSPRPSFRLGTLAAAAWLTLSFPAGATGAANGPPQVATLPRSGPVLPGAAFAFTTEDPDGLGDVAFLAVEIDRGNGFEPFASGAPALELRRLGGGRQVTVTLPWLGVLTELARETRWRVTVRDRAGAETVALAHYWSGLAPPFVRVSGLDLTHKGRPFHFAGFNTYYCMVYGAEPGYRPFVEEVFAEGEQLGLSVLRTFGFNDGASQWNALQLAPGVYDESVFQALDWTLARAGERGFKVILALVNNWDDYGGMNQYVAWSPTATYHDQFYTDPNCKRYFKDHVRAVVTRVNTLTGVPYRDDPTLLAWELANEARCPADPSGIALRNWTAEMASFIHSLDPNHLVTTGSEGFYGPAGAAKNPQAWMSQQGVDFLQQHAVGGIDFATFHVWPDLYGMHLSTTRDWLDLHFLDGATLLEKPVVAEEFGKARPDWLRDVYYAEIYQQVFLSASGGGAAAGSCFWHLIHDAFVPFDDGFGVLAPADASTLSLISGEAARIHAVP